MDPAQVEWIVKFIYAGNLSFLRPIEPDPLVPTPEDSEKVLQLGFDLYKIADFFQLGAIKTLACEMLREHIEGVATRWKTEHDTWRSGRREDEHPNEMSPEVKKLMELAKAAYNLPVGGLWVPLMDHRVHGLLQDMPQMGFDILYKLTVCPYDNAGYHTLACYWRNHPDKSLPTGT
ncbi:hypothetical protein QBC33DRAFT_512817 [Phialemonium atrogriseum]|uniref:Uncharacterized protein n=1 Tax=Phialemonium atrogriseum TaxID=1093897 RepID=A0AAJ0C632_9PEZI|nr:uncharacterized protein QBC33DRAFT_512817 [Phialemonium atrogriseum]KAK1770162.1 hypothetical protein QBC33DRAFT_512817 [Phialemonium atrogriseum]